MPPIHDASLTRDQLLQIQAAFEEALHLPDAQRHAFAYERFAERPRLATRLLELLRIDAHPPALLADRMPATPAGGRPPTARGFDVLEELGRGGMSVVYRARQHEPQRDVALKVLRPAARLLGGDARLRREARALARLSHPGIAQVFEVGVLDTPDDRAFVAMELVSGRPITHWARDARPLRERVDMLARLSEAVAHAHVRGVVHRDLKSANVLVTGEDMPKVLDFGISRLLEGEGDEPTLTREGQLVGTVGAMAPEQWSGPASAVDQRADVYALGALAYEVLAGHPPFELGGLDLPAQLRTIDQGEPSPLGAQSAELRGDLTSIVRKAMERDADRRYDSAGEMAADLRRYLENQPVTARPPTTRYLLAKLVRRHRVPAAAAALVLLTLLGSVAGVSSFAMSEARAAEMAAAAAKEAERSAIDAESARAAEAERAAELELLSEFRERQLGELDIAAMGRTIRQALAAGADADVSGDPAAAALALLDGADLTTVTRDAVYTHIFEPSLAAIDAQFAEQPELRGRLLVRAGSTMNNLGLLDQAAAPIAEGLALLEGALGPDDPRTAAARTRLATSLHSRDRLDEAQAMAEMARDALRSAGGRTEDLLSAISLIGSIRLREGDLDGAEAPLREALDLAGDLGNPGMLATATSNYGSLLLRQGHLEKAERYYREALGLRRAASANPTPDLLVSLNTLGVVLQRQGRVEEAEAYAREVLAASESLHGEVHPSTLTYMNNLAFLLKQDGRLEEAGEVYQRALAGREALHGFDHDYTLSVTSNLAALRRAQGSLEEAHALSRRVLDTRLARGDPENLRLAQVRVAHARILDDMGRLAEAEAELRLAVPVLIAIQGDQHRVTIGARKGLAMVLIGQGGDERFDEAEALLRVALKDGHASRGPTHRETLSARRHLVRLLMRRGRWSQAKAVADAFEAAAGPAAAARFQVWLYDAWHAAEPDAGHDATAARYRALAGLETPAAGAGGN